MIKEDFYAAVFIIGALFIPAAMCSSIVPYGVPTIKLLLTGEW
jgi:hypothetical protein